MKKLLILAVITAHAAIASAQWTSEISKADELKGSSEDIIYTYTDSITGNAFVYWSSTPDQYLLFSNGKIFDFKSGYAKYVGQYSGLEVIVGLYQAKGDLIEKYKMWLDVNASDANHARTRNAGKMSNPVGQSKKVKKIISHLTSTTGYVRIIADLYGGETLDLKIPHR